MRKSSRCLAGLSLTSMLLVVLGATGARGHGPCGTVCLEPNEGAPGTTVSTENLEGVLAVWNPRPNTLPLGVPGMSDHCDIKCARELPIFHLDQPSLVLAESDKREQLHFEVPDAPPGRYLVLVYDGSENGFHYTWQPFTVVAGVAEEAPSGSDVPPWWTAVAALIIGAVLGWLARALVR